MVQDLITSHKDNHYSEEIDHLLLDMIDEVKEINQLWKIKPALVSTKFVNNFIPDFIKLYDLTGDHLELHHTQDAEDDKAVRDLVKGTIYYLDGMTGTNGHTQHVNSKTVLEGIKMFREYKRQLLKEGLMVVY